MLKGKVALVTGSTGGIGLGIAKALAEKGANILLNGFGDTAQIQKVKEEIAERCGVRVAYNGADISVPAQVAEMVSQCISELGGVDILVNNAGIQHTAAVEDFPDDVWEKVIATNLSSNFYACKAALPHMRSRNWGRIINVASVHGLVGSASKSAYVAAKHGVVGLTKVIALETARSGITCNAICPGWVLTPLVQKQIDDKAEHQGVSREEARASLLADKQPSLEFATPEQVGGIAVFLSSAPADQIRGATFSVDGGWTAQ